MKEKHVQHIPYQPQSFDMGNKQGKSQALHYRYHVTTAKNNPCCP
jgi:hypothetical protein